MEQGLDPDEYERKKEEVADLICDRLEAILPGIKKSITYREVCVHLSLGRSAAMPGMAMSMMAAVRAFIGLVIVLHMWAVLHMGHLCILHQCVSSAIFECSATGSAVRMAS